MKYISASNPRYSNRDHTSIDLEVLFESFTSSIPFTACANDSEKHSVDLFNAAIKGEFGEIAPYSGPSEEEEKAALARQKRDGLLKSLDRIVSNPLRWSEFSSQEKEAYSTYRQQLLDVPQQILFPNEIEWPVLDFSHSK